MRKILFLFVILVLVTIPINSAQGWPPPNDSHPCYLPNNVFTWCNLDLPNQRFEGYMTMDWRPDVEVDYQGTTYHVTIKIYGVYYANGQRKPGCQSSAATPACFWNTWTCVWNVGDPYYQNWDACVNRANKLMLYCWPVQGCIDVTGTGANAPIAYYLNIYLDTEANMLRPATGAPRLIPYEDSRHVYAMRPTVMSGGRYCPNYSQPTGCP